MDGDGAPLTIRRRRALRVLPGLLLAAIPLVFLALFFVHPLVTILLAGLAPAGVPDLSALGEVLTDDGLRGVAAFTLWQALLSTALTMLVGLPLAWVFVRFDFPGRGLLRAAATVPFVLPTVVVGSAFLALLGPRSPINAALMAIFGLATPPLDLRNSFAAILLAHVFYNVPIVIRVVGGLAAHLDPRSVDAARVLGASPGRAFREVTLPLVAPAIAAAAAIVFLFTFSSFGVILILGGPRFATLEVEIYRQTLQRLDLPTAAALALVQLVGVVLLLAAYGRAQDRLGAIQRLRAPVDVARRPRGRREWTIVGTATVVMALLLWLPLAVLVERSLATVNGYSLAAYTGLGEQPRGSALFVPPIDAVRNSLLFAAAATLIASVVGLAASAVLAGGRRGVRAAAPRRALDLLVMLPLGTSAVTVGFGFLLALDSPPLDLRTSPALIPIAHALVAVPFVVRAGLPVLRSLDRRLREQAQVLGASPFRAWREVDLPIVARVLLVAAGLAFAVSLGEFGATAFIARPETPTLPVAIFRLLAQPGTQTFAAAMAMSTVLLLVTGLALLLIERARPRALGDF